MNPDNCARAIRLGNIHSEKHLTNSEIYILGIRYDNLTRNEVLDIIESSINDKCSKQICTPNADHIVQAHYDREFKNFLRTADLVVSDGMAIVYASRLLKRPLKENVGGRLILTEFSKRAEEKGYKIYLLGGRSELYLNRAKEKLKSMFPLLVIAGAFSPPYKEKFDEEENRRLIKMINKSGAEVLFVCLGTPKQEKWIAENKSKLNTAVNIGVGAAIDMLAGVVYMPPRWISKYGLEWVVRFLQEPKRLWKRYFLRGTIFIWWVIKEKVKNIVA